MSKQRNRRSDILNFVLGLAVIALLNVVSNYLFTRVDLTAEGRFTLRPTTVKLLREMKDQVTFNVYLDGDFPQGTGDYRRLRDETRYMLDAFRAVAGDHVQFQFINPLSNPDLAEQKKTIDQLTKRGVRAYQIGSSDEGSITQQVIFPWALANLNGASREVAVPLLGTENLALDPERLNKAVMDLEYQFVNAIKKLRQPVRQRIAILQGHGEVDTLSGQIYKLSTALKEYYDVDFLNIDGKISALRDTAPIRNKYKALIIPRPQRAFSLPDQLVLDQYVMYGGNVLWMVNPIDITEDTLYRHGYSETHVDSLAVDDMLFRYGVRLNHDFVIDKNCSQLPLVRSVDPRDPQLQPYPWPYYPIVIPQGVHPIVRNLDGIQLHFASTLDTVNTTTPVKKTILLTSSKDAGIRPYPLPVNFREARNIMNNPNNFLRHDLPLAVLLEGTFPSAFANQPAGEAMKREPSLGYLSQSRPGGRMIVIGDGQVCMNSVDFQHQKINELGYDGYMFKITGGREYMYANKAFLLNCVNYLCGDDEMLELRAREITLRKLDPRKVEKTKLAWTIYNTVMPVLFVVLFGVVFVISQRRKYRKDQYKASLWIVSAMVFVIFCSAGWVISLGMESMASKLLLWLIIPAVFAVIAWLLGRRFSQ